MNKLQNDMNAFINTMVVVKFNNGRAISGVLRDELNGSYAIKLGTKILGLDLTKISNIKKL